MIEIREYMEPLNIISGVIVIMLALPHIFFNRERWAGFWIFFLVISGFAMFNLIYLLLMGVLSSVDNENKDIVLKVFSCAAPTVAIPYIILKFYWGQQDKAKEFELKEWELELKQKELNLKRRELDY